MHLLDNPTVYRRLDPNNTVGSVKSLGLQCRQAWEGMRSVKLPPSYRNAQRICIIGMGGSALGGNMLRAIYGQSLAIPLDVVNSYVLPAYVDEQTLLILSSYSGTTGEVLACRADALRRRAKVFVITNGGALGKWAKAKRLPAFIFDDSAGNPSDQPRMGLGYSVFGQLALLVKLGLLRVSERDVRDIEALLTRCNKRWGVAVPFRHNPAKQLAAKVQNKIVQLVASEHLAGNVHVWANQTNETAKTLSDYRIIPELNHHLLEGLPFPKQNRQLVYFVLFTSLLYDPRNRLRHTITQQVLRGNHIGFSRAQLTAATRLGQAMEMLLLGSYVTLYQALLGNVNPSKIPWVDFFKAALKKRTR